MTYYGRWTYKYEIGAQKGAAGVLIVHETGPAGYRFNVVQGKTGEQFDLVTPDKNMGRAADRRLDHARQGEGAAADGRPGFRRAEGAGGDARLQAGAARRDRVDDDSQQAAHDRFAERDREARRARSEAEGRVRRLHRALGSLRQDAGRHLPRRRGRCARVRGADRDGARVHEAAGAAAALDPVSRRHRRRAGAARLAVLLGRRRSIRWRRPSPTSTWTAGTRTGARRI